MKTISMTVTRRVPNKFKWLAQDSDGEWWAWSVKPIVHLDSEVWHGPTTNKNVVGDHCIKIAIGDPNKNWQNTLQEI